MFLLVMKHCSYNISKSCNIRMYYSHAIVLSTMSSYSQSKSRMELSSRLMPHKFHENINILLYNCVCNNKKIKKNHKHIYRKFNI